MCNTSSLAEVESFSAEKTSIAGSAGLAVAYAFYTRGVVLQEIAVQAGRAVVRLAYLAEGI